MARNHQGGLESSISGGKMNLGQLRREVAELNKSDLPYEIISTTRDILITQYERDSGRRVDVLEYIRLLDFSALHEVLAPGRKEFRKLAEYYIKHLPEMLRQS